MEWETATRLAVFLGLFALLAAAEAWRPRRPRRLPRATRWTTNWAIVLIDTLALRLVAIALPLLAVGAALDAGRLGVGLFNLTGWPFWVEALLTILILDWLIWAQHWATHHWPLLWRIHRVHHADPDMDVSTAIRFHPLEIALSMLLKIGAVYLLGPSAVAVILFEILLNAAALFNHANLALPARVDRCLRWVVVTPDMHRIHHSTERAEHDSNYGFFLSVWDRLFGTYRPNPSVGHGAMTLGLSEWRDDAPARLGWSLTLPFRR